MMIDNMVFKGRFYKATSSITDLHRIALRLHESEMRDNLIVQVIHVAGTCMK